MSLPSSAVFTCQTVTLGPELQVSIGPTLHLWFFAFKQRFSPRIPSHYGSQLSTVVLCTHNSGIMTRINSLYESQTSSVVLCIQSSVISTRITSLHGSKTSPVVLCLQNNAISIRNTSLYVSLPSSTVFTFQTAPLGPELQVSMGP